MWTGFFGPTRRGYAAAADSSPGLCASDAQSPMREPLHNKNRYGRPQTAPPSSCGKCLPDRRAAVLSCSGFNALNALPGSFRGILP